MANETNKVPESGIVTVACKLPHGLIMRIYEMEDASEQVMGGGARTFKRARQVGDEVKLNGYAVPFGQAPEHPVVAGFALTHNVDAGFFKAWMAANKDHAAVKNGLIFGYAQLDSVTSQAKERGALRSGLEPLNPNKVTQGGVPVYTDPRMPRSTNANISTLETATEVGR